MTRSHERPTVLDVLDNQLGETWHLIDVHRLSDDVIADLFIEIGAFYDAWPGLKPAEGIRTFSEYERVLAGLPVREEKILSTLLYFDEVVVEDPLAPLLSFTKDPFFGLRYASSDHHTNFLDFARMTLDRSLRHLAELRPLIESGLILLVPATQMVADQIDDSHEPFAELVEAGCRDPAFLATAKAVFPEPTEGEEADAFSRMVRSAEIGMGISMPPVADHLFVTALLNTATTFVARETQSLYLPISVKWWLMLLVYLRILEEDLPKGLDLDIHVAEAVLESDIPYFSNMSAQTILDVHTSDENFAAWRSELRTALNGLRSIPGTSEFREEATILLNDFMGPRASAVSRATSRSHTLRAAARDPGIAFAVGTAAAAGQMAGIPITGSVATAGFSAFGAWALKLLFRDHPSGANAIVARLIDR